MSQWPSVKAKRLLAALLRLGWQIKRQSGSHKTLARNGWPDFVFAFHDGDEIGPKMLARVSKHTGLSPNDLQSQPYAQAGLREGAAPFNFTLTISFSAQSATIYP
ncbi:MAG: type II toxin-antitoxin system HicA family toxin [Gallionellaceae bacterium]